MTRNETVAAKLVADLQPTFEGWSDPVVFGIGWDRAVYATARRSTETLTEPHGIGIFPKSKLEQATDYLVVRCEAGEVRTLVVRGEALVVSYVQPFPGGILLAGSRCHWRREGAERNAVAVDWTGRELARFTLGDGIADLRVTRDGTMWASYFDEGVFGDYGWSHPGPPAIGASGLVAFSKIGEVEFSFDPKAAHTDSVCDAYALNVAGDRDTGCGARWTARRSSSSSLIPSSRSRRNGSRSVGALQMAMNRHAAKPRRITIVGMTSMSASRHTRGGQL